MRAAVLSTPGTSEAIELVEVPVPDPGPGEIRVRVEAAGVNPVDLQTVAGIFHDLGFVRLARIGLGWEVAGLVSEVGSGVSLRVGTPVAALSGGVDKPLGAYAEEIVLPAGDVAVRPDGLDATTAASVPLNSLTATQALDLLGPARGRSLLITGAAGAVGGYAAQLAVERGFVVTGLARAWDEAFVRSTGATPATTLPDRPAFDAVLDAAVLGEVARDLVHDDGHYVGVIPAAVPPAARGVRMEAVHVSPDGVALANLLKRTAQGELPARVRSVVPLTDVVRAHREAATGGLRGRIVLSV
jgi:NADPH:quinone reductase-like Zn-dependent oxidoreductase